MTRDRDASVRQDCLATIAKNPSIHAALANRRIAVTGGTGFLGTWLAETIAALNDEYTAGITLDLIAPRVVEWSKTHPHLAARKDIGLSNTDVGSVFEFERQVAYVIHAAGIPDGRVHASDPLRVFRTTVTGAGNVLEAAARLPQLERFLNVSSGLVYGGNAAPPGMDEETYHPLDSSQVSAVYAEAKRAAETLCSSYRSQMRLPVVTVRPFTFVGPYQDLNRPWALNNFLRDSLAMRDIRLHGDGENLRSFLYGSDAACWSLVALVEGQIGRAYNLGSAHVVSLRAAAEQVAELFERRPSILLRTVPSQQRRQADFFPSTVRVSTELKVKETVDLASALRKTVTWNRRTTDSRAAIN